MKRFVKKAVVGIMAASLVIGAVPFTAVNAKAATVTKGEYDFSNMTVRRIWFNTADPVFFVDNYQRVWLDDNVNALAYGDVKTTTAAGNLMAPVQEALAQLGISYTEAGDDITIVMNGQTIKFKIGSKDVAIDGKTVSGALTDEQVPVRVNVKEKFGDFNTYLTGDYMLTYLPVAYLFNTFGADIYYDGNAQSFYAAVPIFNTDITPDYATTVKTYGHRYDEFIKGALNDTYELVGSVADNIVALQNEDGGFQILPANIDMAQDDIVANLGSLKDSSTLENGSTVAQLRYLARYITEKKPEDTKYQAAFLKGIDYIVKNQSANGGWQMSPTAAQGFNGNVVIGNNVTTEVLRLLQDIAVLNNQNYVFARKTADVKAVEAAFDKGNDFLAAAQISNDGVKAGWSTQVKADGTITMGRTYEREAVSAFTTKSVTEYLMSIHNPSDAIKAAVEASVKWLETVKIPGIEEQIVKDTSMNNGFDIFVVAGAGTWARDYVYDAASKSYRPLYSDVDPKKADQKMVHVNPTGDNVSYDYNDMILYSTRTSIDFYDNTLATNLINEDYALWKSYLASGFPEIPTDPVEPEIPTDPEKPTTPDGGEDDTQTPGGGNTGDTEEPGNAPQSGDTANMLGFIILGTVSVLVIAGCGVLYVYNKKKEIK